MTAGERRPGSKATFLLECYWPGVTAHDVANIEARMAHEQPTDENVRYLGSILVPTDEIMFCLYGGSATQEVKEAAARAGIPFDRIRECIDFRLRSPPSVISLIEQELND